MRAGSTRWSRHPQVTSSAPTFPTRLSESGLFRSVKGHVPEPALIPYTVNAPLWSDGAYKERYIALPGDDSQIEFTASGGWNFPDRAVLVKSFALETEEGNPRSRRWIETRFLTKQEGEWVGYSYLWNEAQTEATLVEASGADREFVVRVPKSEQSPDGVRKQTWHYPSRAECMVVPQSRRQLRPRLDDAADEPRARLRESPRQPAPSAGAPGNAAPELGANDTG